MYLSPVNVHELADRMREEAWEKETQETTKIDNAIQARHEVLLDKARAEGHNSIEEYIEAIKNDLKKAVELEWALSCAREHGKQMRRKVSGW